MEELVLRVLESLKSDNDLKRLAHWLVRGTQLDEHKLRRVILSLLEDDFIVQRRIETLEQLCDHYDRARGQLGQEGSYRRTVKWTWKRNAKVLRDYLSKVEGTPS